MRVIDLIIYIRYARIIINPFDLMSHTLLFKILNLNLKKQRLFIKSDVSNSRDSWSSATRCLSDIIALGIRHVSWWIGTVSRDRNIKLKQLELVFASAKRGHIRRVQRYKTTYRDGLNARMRAI